VNKPIEEEILGFIRSSLLKKSQVQLVAKTLLFKDHIIDSMNILDLIGFIEKKLGRRLSGKEVVMSNFKNVSAMRKAFFHGKK
jgi:acyl carrier protein